jgi:hypothetical protein
MTIYLCSARGSLPGGEVFQFSLHINDSGASTITDVLDGWASALDTLWSGDGVTVDGISLHYTPLVSFQTLRVSSLDAGTGRQTDAVEQAYVHAGTHASGVCLPQEVSIAVSTRGASVNRRNRGRFFLPPPAADVADNNGLVAATPLGDIADCAQAFLNVLIVSSLTPVLYHRDLLTSTTIVTVDVGNVFDAQRRRRNKLVETRQSRPVPTP